MRKKDYIILLIILLNLLLGCDNDVALGAEKTPNKLENINYYDIDVDLNFEDMTYSAKQTVTYSNKTGSELNELYFHIYPNAFNRLETAPIIFDQEFKDPSLFIPGSIEINSIRMNETKLEYEIQGEDNTILRVILSRPLLKDEKIELYMEYKVKIPNTKDRFGYGNRTVNLGNWYPILCVYDEDGWSLEPYYKLGDPFYSDVSNYSVRIKTHKDIIVASSGNIIKEEIIENNKIYTIEGNLIRDFAFVASKDLKIREDKVANTTVKLYYLDEVEEMADYALEAGVDSIKIFNKIFGVYPYENYSIVMTEFPSGMEYPTIVFIGNDYFTYLRRSILEQIIVHETAHQWWYGLVGSNQVSEAWLDEGLTTYSETIYMREKYGKNTGENYFYNNVELGYDYGKNFIGKNENFNQHLGEFNGWDDYGILVYTRSAMFINDIKDNYGEDTLYKILKEYFNRYKYLNATTEDFLKICREFTDSDMDLLIVKWIY